MNTEALKQQGLALCADQKALVSDTTRTWAQKQAEYDKRDKDIKALIAQVRAQEAVDGKFGRPGGPFAMLEDPSGQTWANAGRVNAKGGLVADGVTQIQPPRMTMSNTAAAELYEAANSKRSLSIETKATDSTSVPQALIPNYQTTPLTALREPTRVLDVIPTFATPSPVVTWYTTTGTAAAAAVAEGGTKPTSTISYNPVNGAVTKLAHVAEVTDETLQDFQGFMGVLQSDMVAGLIVAENAELLTATVTGAHKFAGLLNTSGILTRAVGADTRLDAILKGFDDLRTGSSFCEPDALIIHPTDWGTLRRLKDANGQYYLAPGDVVSGPEGTTVWGVKTVVTSQITVGTALLGAFQFGTRAYIRDSLRVETNALGTTQFVANTCLVRAEERLLLTVPRPTSLVKITGL